MRECSMKEVRYDKYCAKCEFLRIPEISTGRLKDLEPCIFCLDSENAVREGTEKPLYFKPIPAWVKKEPKIDIVL